MPNSGFQELTFPRHRIGSDDVLRVTSDRQVIHGLIEVDMTDPLKTIHEYEQRTGDDISVVAFIAHCLGKAIDEDKRIQAFRRGRKLIVHDDVDVNIMIEREAGGGKIVAQHVLRQTNRRGVLEMCREIRESQRNPIEHGRPLRLLELYAAIPAFLRRPLMRLMLRNPHRFKAMGGTTAITSVGMFGQGAGWGIPVVPVAVMLTLGGMAKKPAVVDGRIEIRDLLCVTVSFDHTITDGAPAARFTSRLKQLIEGGSGLEVCRSAVSTEVDSDIVSKQVSATFP